MAALPYIQLYTADYLADTAHLSTLDNGAYLLLMFNYWQRGESFKAKDEQSLNRRLASVARLSIEDWMKVSEELKEFFVIIKHDDCIEWRHNRIEHELGRVRDKSIKASSAGKRSAQARTKGGEVKNNECSTNVKQTLNHTDTDKDKDNIKKIDKKSSQGTRLPDDFIMPDDWLAIGKDLRDELSDKEIKLSADKFIDYWHSAAGAKATKRDWLATWRNWIRSHRPNFSNIHKFPDKNPVMQANTGNINYREGLRIGSDGEYIF